MSVVPLNIQSHTKQKTTNHTKKRWKNSPKNIPCYYHELFVYGHEPHLGRCLCEVVFTVECLILLHLTWHIFIALIGCLLTMWESWRASYFPVSHSFLYSSTVSSFMYPFAKLTLVLSIFLSFLPWSFLKTVAKCQCQWFRVEILSK